MTYRMINVDGRDYQFVVGGRDLKVKGFPSVSKHEIGVRYDNERIAITPAIVAAYIRRMVDVHS